MNGEASRHSSKGHHHHGGRSHRHDRDNEYDGTRKDYDEDDSRSRRLQDAYEDGHMDNH